MPKCHPHARAQESPCETFRIFMFTSCDFFQANLLLQHVCKAGNGSIPKPPTKETKYKKGKKDKEKKEKEKEKEKDKEAAAEAKVCTVSFELFRTEVSTYCYWHSYNM